MKTIQQKAKAYDEAIEKIKYVMEHGVQPVLNKEDLQGIFPELKENNDDKIRKHLISLVKNWDKDGIAPKYTSNPNDIKQILAWLEKLKVFSEHGYGLYYFASNGFAYVGNTTCDNVSWLEKQGEKPQGKTALEAIKEKPADNANKVEPKFEVGDFIVNDYCMGRIVEITNDAYLLDTEQGIPFSCHSTRLWDITKDAKDGDLIYVGTEEKGIQAIFHEYKNGTIFFYCYLCGDFAQGGGYMPIGSVELAYPLQKNHYNRFFEKMKEAGYIWDADKKELKLLITNGDDFEQENCEQKPAWSEEDSVRLQRIIDFLWHNRKGDTDTIYQQEQDIDWLKSLKDRVGCEANCTTTKELSESDEEEFQIAIDTLVEAGQRDSAHWLESIKDRVQPHWKPSGEQIDAFEHFVKSIGESGFAYPHNHNTKCVYSLLNDLKKL